MKLLPCLGLVTVASALRFNRTNSSIPPEEGAGWGALAGAIAGGVLANQAVTTQIGKQALSTPFWTGVVAGSSVASAAAGAAIGAGAGYEAGKRRCAKLMSDSGTRPVQGFTMDSLVQSYIKYAWFPQYQNPQTYQTKDELNCTSAYYYKRGNEQKNLPNGWFLNVSNMGVTDKQDNDTDGFLCARVHDADKNEAYLQVGPCGLKFGGPYWVVRYNEDEGYAIIIGGMPDRMVLPHEEAVYPIKCGFQNKMENGMWAFTREREASDTKKEKLLQIMSDELKLDTSDLLETPQHDCGDWDKELCKKGANIKGVNCTALLASS